MTQEFPLQWPDGWPRARSRKAAAFSNKGARMDWRTAEHRCTEEIERLWFGSAGWNWGAGHIFILSSNVIRDRLPADPGVALYFQKKGDAAMRVIAIDIYDRAPDNAAAIAATIEAMRAIDRHGGAQILERAFKGFDALPAPRRWQDVLALGSMRRPTLDDAEAAYRRQAKILHPDAGGSVIEFQELNGAIAAARRELGT